VEHPYDAGSPPTSPAPEETMMHRTWTPAVVAASMLLLAACGGDGDGGGDAVTELAVDGTNELRFEPDEYTIPAGQEVTVELTSDGVEHDFVIEGVADFAEGGEQEEDLPEGDVEVVHADAGETASGTVTVNEPGTYEVYCNIPGHREAGMLATLTVVDDG
jgi:uncharacterized cupredoxin-like copper-binding protein